MAQQGSGKGACPGTVLATVSLAVRDCPWLQFAGVLVSLWYVDWAGRRPLMVWGGVGCTAALLLLALGDAARSFPIILLAMCAFLFAFSASYGAQPPDPSISLSPLFNNALLLSSIFLLCACRALVPLHLP